MLYEVKGLIPSKPTKVPLRVKDLKHGDLAVVIEEGEDFGQHILTVHAGDGSRDWFVCLNDATIPCSSTLRNRICCLVKPPNEVKLVFTQETPEVVEIVAEE